MVNKEEGAETYRPRPPLQAKLAAPGGAKETTQT